MAKSERETRLIENFEDAKMSLLMFYLSEKKGAEALSEYQSLRPERENIPVEIDKRCRAAIRNGYTNKNAKTVFTVAGKVLSKVAIFVLIINIAFVTLFTTASAFRANVLKFLYETFDVATVISLNSGDEPGGPTDAVGDVPAPTLELSWLPEGYELEEKTEFGNGEYRINYKNNNEDEIYFERLNGTANLYIDTENADIVKDITVQGYTGLYVKKGERLTVVWGDTENNNIYYIIAKSISEEEMSKIIENIK